MQAISDREEATASIRRVGPAWWRLTIALCAVVLALSSIVIAQAEVRQARYLDQANCADRAQAGGENVERPNSSGKAENELRRCLGLPERP